MERYSEFFLSANSILGNRDCQQDYYITKYYQDRAIAIICDGMGGMVGGEIASRTVAETLLCDLEAVEIQGDMSQFFKKELEKLDDIVFGLRDAKGNRLGAGTTVVAVLIVDNLLYWFSVGDSKIYYKRDTEMCAITREHNYALKLAGMLDDGEINEEEYIQEMVRGEQLISYLGMGTAEMYDCNYSPFHMAINDCVLLCTDGVYRTLSEQEISGILASDSVEQAGKYLEKKIASKNVYNQDNATWIIIQRR